MKLTSAFNDTSVLWIDNVRMIYVPHPYPTVTTDPATNVQLTGATLNATISPNNSTDSVIGFNWGTSTSYGNFHAATTTHVSGSTSTPVSATLYGLTSNTTYYYQAVVQTCGWFFYGTQQTFYTTTTVTDIPNTTTESLIIYPNPAKHQFNVQTQAANSTLILYNMIGGKVSETVISQPLTTIDVSGYANGIYMLSLKQGEAVKTYRLAIMND